MSADDFVRFVKSIQYKRGYEFSADCDWARGATIMRLRMIAAVSDAGDPGHYISVTQGEWFSVEDLKRMEPSQILHVVKDFILAFERHEFGEWFKVGEVKPFDPHYQGDPAVLEHSAFAGETYGRGSQ